MSAVTMTRWTNRAGLHAIGFGAVSAALALGCCSAAWGQALSDPTRPAAAWLAAQPKTGGAEVVEAAPRLQSLLIGPSRRYAIIEGQLVGVGDTFKDTRVVAVRPTGVVLRSQRGTETLKIFPDVEKRAPAPPEAEAKRPPRKGAQLRPKQPVRRSIVIEETKVTKETK